MSVDPKARRALGRGLDALLPSAGAVTTKAGTYTERSVFHCPIERLVPQKGQPRQHFDEQEIEDLAASIREHGLIEPLVVRRAQAGADTFEIIAGERRWRASQRAGLTELLVVVKDVSPKDAFELALVENVQRADLNPIEVAEAYDRLLREHGYTQDRLAERVGRDRTTITNSLRLLRLPARIRSHVISRELSEGHARALLGAADEKAMNDIADRALRGKLPVRKVEAMVRASRTDPKDKDKGKDAGPAQKSASVRDVEARLSRRLGARVELVDRGGSGDLVVHWSSLDELDRILATLGA